MAAWGDVARRIAHEIKNPLTPIQLSAERHAAQVRRRWSRRRRAPTSSSMTDVIVRQTDDLRRIVDEFSQVRPDARARAPRRSTSAALVRDAVLLQEAAQPDVRYRRCAAGASRCWPISTRR